MIIVDLIKEFMYQNDMDINDVAEATGLSYTTIENIVKRDRIPSVKDANLIFGIFGVTLDEILSLY